MDIFELLQEMYENKELHCRKKNLYSLKVRPKTKKSVFRILLLFLYLFTF